MTCKPHHSRHSNKPKARKASTAIIAKAGTVSNVGDTDDKKAANRLYNRRWYANLSPERKEEIRTRNRECRRRWYANLSPETKEERRTRNREAKRRWYANLSPEKKEEVIARNREYTLRKRRAKKKSEKGMKKRPRKKICGAKKREKRNASSGAAALSTKMQTRAAAALSTKMQTRAAAALSTKRQTRAAAALATKMQTRAAASALDIAAAVEEVPTVAVMDELLDQDQADASTTAAVEEVHVPVAHQAKGEFTMGVDASAPDIAATVEGPNVAVESNTEEAVEHPHQAKESNTELMDNEVVEFDQFPEELHQPAEEELFVEHEEAETEQREEAVERPRQPEETNTELDTEVVEFDQFQEELSEPEEELFVEDEETETWNSHVISTMIQRIMDVLPSSFVSWLLFLIGLCRIYYFDRSALKLVLTFLITCFHIGNKAVETAYSDDQVPPTKNPLKGSQALVLSICIFGFSFAMEVMQKVCHGLSSKYIIPTMPS